MFIFNPLFQEMQGNGDSEEEILDEFRSKILQTRDKFWSSLSLFSPLSPALSVTDFLDHQVLMGLKENTTNALYLQHFNTSPISLCY